MRGIVLFFLFSGIISAHAETPRLQVLTTIKPITMLAYAVAGEKVEILQLIPDYLSVHDYSFKPSDIRKIKNANIIFRIDEHLETIFTPIFNKLPNTIDVISLAEIDNIRLLSITKKHHDKQLDHHDHGSTDLHIWTSPQNAIIMAKKIAQVLIIEDPKNSNTYQKNLQSLIDSIHASRQKIIQSLSNSKNITYIVFHNSWQYFQRDFDLPKPIIIALNENFIPGVKTIRTTRKRIAESKVSCVFSDPSVSKSRIRTLIDGYDVKHAEIDSLGSGLKLNKSSYIHWMKIMEENIAHCL